MVKGMRRTLGTGAAVVAGCAALAAGALSPAAASDAAGQSSARAVRVEQVTIRLASDPGQVANVRGNSSQNGAAIIQWPLSRAANERWRPESTGGGYYRFRSVSSGKCINVRGGGSADGTAVIQYTCGTAANEQWRMVPKGKGYQLVARSSGKCLNVRGGVGRGNPLIQYRCTAAGAANDVWLLSWETRL
ncbi:RICIN domain-containing protein [Streptomyces sp. GMY02]|uniref:RICIN domain-containing protein n=1 Tax=Streptomyces sp. GMY02 TaxID=1333528 RepID=UPI0020B7BD75|nr:RICIN domain-containing protein [Streptomyces sp. GMY02]